MVPLSTLVHFTSFLSLSFLLLSTPLVTTHAKLPSKTNTATTVTSTSYIIQTDNLTRPSQFTSQTQWYASIIQSLLPIKTRTTSTAAAVKRIFYTYETVLHGFAVTLTPPEAQTISTITGVIGVYEDRTIQPLTTRSPDFLGLNTDFGLWPESNSGQDVVIGLVDTGIWPESRSFDDVGLPPVRATWRGQCVDGTRFNASLLCNNKLVGASEIICTSPPTLLALLAKDLHTSTNHGFTSQEYL
ncbi:subtilisin-like protease SBT3 [Typha angustifolia]|uniref:subtilisin-like protease SBT3 n=1 Tax=Typha angustifolia TaxID=59011 RepID=UPI003C2B2052